MPGLLLRRSSQQTTDTKQLVCDNLEAATLLYPVAVSYTYPMARPLTESESSGKGSPSSLISPARHNAHHRDDIHFVCDEGTKQGLEGRKQQQ